MHVRRHPRRQAAQEQPVRLTGLPHRVLLPALTAVVVAGLAAVALMALQGDPRHAWDGLRSALQDPRVLLPLAAVLGIAMLACARTWAYWRLQTLPGAMHVIPIEDATRTRGDDDGISLAELARLDVHFRQRLSELRLSAPTPTPGAASTDDFVELLETSKIDPKQPFAAIGRVIRIVRPTHAYEVKTKLLLRQDAPTHGLAMEVVVLPQRRTTMRTYWQDGWEDALDRAATGVTAEVIPRSRHSDSGTWSSWKGMALDEGLLDLYQRAQRRSREHRYEEALELMYAAVKRDPSNCSLRYSLGVLQEELALYLDALLTYASIPRLADAPVRGRRRRANRRIVIFADYRYTILLGFGEQLGEQWLAAPSDAAVSKRSDELRVLRERLRPLFTRHFANVRRTVNASDLRLLRLHRDTDEMLERLLDDRPHLEWQRGSTRGELRREMSAREKIDNRRLRERRLHLFFQILAQTDVERLLRECSPRHLRRYDTGLTRMSVELLPEWAELRTARARHMLRSEVRRQTLRRRHSGKDTGAARKLRPARLVGAWPPTPDEIRTAWNGRRWPLRRSLLARLDRSPDFMDHYNAACTYAIALLPSHGDDDGVAPERVQELADAAVIELKRAAAVGGSSALAARWDWILAEDPDLAGLRGENTFRRFESERLPSPRVVPVRPSSITRLNASRFSVRLCHLCSRSLEDVWQARADMEGPVPIANALLWWRDEAESWELARELVHHHRHWQTRLRVIAEMQRFHARNNRAPFATPHRRYSDDPIEGPPEAVDRAARHEIHFGDLRLTTLAKALGEPYSGPLPGFEAWKTYLTSLDVSGEPLCAEERLRLATNRAAAWRSLRQAFGERGTTEKAPHERFERRFNEVVASLAQLPPPISRAGARSRSSRPR